MPHPSLVQTELKHGNSTAKFFSGALKFIRENLKRCTGKKMPGTVLEIPQITLFTAFYSSPLKVSPLISSSPESKAGGRTAAIRVSQVVQNKRVRTRPGRCLGEGNSDREPSNAGSSDICSDLKHRAKDDSEVS